DGFFAAADADPPLDDGVRLVRELSTTHDVIWLTGRPERSRGITTAWLAGHGLPVDEVLMRPDADRRPARLFKRAELRRLAKSRRIAVVVDDDPEVVALLRTDGWPVELADWVPYEDVLGRAQESEGRT
nr:hypothetical protein [Micromonospora sp. DSM 115978]